MFAPTGSAINCCFCNGFFVHFLPLGKKRTKETSGEGDAPSSMTPCCASAGIADANRSYRLKLPPAGHKYTPQATAELKSAVQIIVGDLLKFFALLLYTCYVRTALRHRTKIQLSNFALFAPHPFLIRRHVNNSSTDHTV